MKHGLFVTFEGGEGAGKSTLIEGVFQALQSRYQVLRTREPGGTFLAEEVRSLLLKKRSEKVSAFAELALFLAARAQHIEELIIPSLSSGKVVLCDRFNDSSIAYQGIARGLGKEKVQKVCGFFSQELVPDVTFYLDIDPKLGLARVQRSRLEKDRIEEESLAFHTKIRNAYLEIAADHPSRVFVIDATLPKEEVLDKVLSILQPLLISKQCFEML